MQRKQTQKCLNHKGCVAISLCPYQPAPRLPLLMPQLCPKAPSKPFISGSCLSPVSPFICAHRRVWICCSRYRLISTNLQSSAAPFKGTVGTLKSRVSLSGASQEGKNGGVCSVLCSLRGARAGLLGSEGFAFNINQRSWSSSGD